MNDIAALIKKHEAEVAQKIEQNEILTEIGEIPGLKYWLFYDHSLYGERAGIAFELEDFTDFLRWATEDERIVTASAWRDRYTHMGFAFPKGKDWTDATVLENEGEMIVTVSVRDVHVGEIKAKVGIQTSKGIVPIRFKLPQCGKIMPIPSNVTRGQHGQIKAVGSWTVPSGVGIHSYRYNSYTPNNTEVKYLMTFTEMATYYGVEL